MLASKSFYYECKKMYLQFVMFEHKIHVLIIALNFLNKIQYLSTDDRRLLTEIHPYTYIIICWNVFIIFRLNFLCCLLLQAKWVNCPLWKNFNFTDWLFSWFLIFFTQFILYKHRKMYRCWILDAGRATKNICCDFWGKVVNRFCWF